jgi:hypothetical protein
MCLECASGYFSKKLDTIEKNMRRNFITKKGDIKCPGTYHSEAKNQCKVSLSLEQLHFPLTFSYKEQVDKLVYAMANKDTLLCMNPECSKLLFFEGGVTIRIECPYCTMSWCTQCLAFPFHDDFSCMEHEMTNRSTDNGKAMWDMKAEGILQFCPECKSPVIKNGGCNKIYCLNCESKWCWLCRKVGIDYDHYNEATNTGCGNKLWDGVDIEVEM